MLQNLNYIFLPNPTCFNLTLCGRESNMTPGKSSKPNSHQLFGGQVTQLCTHNPEYPWDYNFLSITYWCMEKFCVWKLAFHVHQRRKVTLCKLFTQLSIHFASLDNSIELQYYLCALLRSMCGLLSGRLEVSARGFCTTIKMLQLRLFTWLRNRRIIAPRKSD